MNRLATFFTVSMLFFGYAVPALHAQAFQAAGAYMSESSLYYPHLRLVVRYTDTTGGARYGFPTIHEVFGLHLTKIPPGAVAPPGMAPGAESYTTTEIPAEQRRQSATYRDSGIKKRRSN